MDYPGATDDAREPFRALTRIASRIRRKVPDKINSLRRKGSSNFDSFRRKKPAWKLRYAEQKLHILQPIEERFQLPKRRLGCCRFEGCACSLFDSREHTKKSLRQVKYLLGEEAAVECYQRTAHSACRGCPHGKIWHVSDNESKYTQELMDVPEKEIKKLLTAKSSKRLVRTTSSCIPGSLAAQDKKSREFAREERSQRNRPNSRSVYSHNEVGSKSIALSQRKYLHQHTQQNSSSVGYRRKTRAFVSDKSMASFAEETDSIELVEKVGNNIAETGDPEEGVRRAAQTFRMKRHQSSPVEGKEQVTIVRKPFSFPNSEEVLDPIANGSLVNHRNSLMIPESLTEDQSPNDYSRDMNESIINESQLSNSSTPSESLEGIQSDDDIVDAQNVFEVLSTTSTEGTVMVSDTEQVPETGSLVGDETGTGNHPVDSRQPNRTTIVHNKLTEKSSSKLETRDEFEPRTTSSATNEEVKYLPAVEEAMSPSVAHAS